jgi:hypothetical protein
VLQLGEEPLDQIALVDVANPAQQIGRDTGYHSLGRSTVRAGGTDGRTSL